MLPSQIDQSRCKYAQDLRTLRQKKGVSIDTIHQETQIIKTVLEEYEINCLQHNDRFNRVYLQSLTKAYSQVVGLDVEKVLEALEAALGGRYDGRLNPNYKKPVKNPAKSTTSVKSARSVKSGRSAKQAAQESANTKAPSKGASSPKEDKQTKGG